MKKKNNMKKLMIRQPGYLPNVGFFKKIQSSDIFIFLDDAQFVKDRFDNRNKIRTKINFQWLTVPLKRPVFKKNLNQVQIDNEQKWANYHLEKLNESYEKCEYFTSYWNDISKILIKKYNKLIDLNMNLIDFFCNELKIFTPCFFSSSFPTEKTSTAKLVHLCKSVDADCYVSGISGHEYLDEKIFSENNLRLIYENFVHPIYPQIHGDFLENMSIIDLIMNTGDLSKKILLECKNY